MDLIKKYWFWFIIGIVFIAVLLNFILIIPAFTPIVGDSADWLLFFATIIGSSASFAMVFFTAKTLQQNKEQLNEMKRQWEEEHKPYLSCQLVDHNDHYLLRIINSSKVTANKVRIQIDSKLHDIQNDSEVPYEPNNFDKLKAFFAQQTFVIPPNESLYFDIWITAYKEISHLPSGYISVGLFNDKLNFGEYRLKPQHFAFATFEPYYYGDSVIEAIKNVSKTIENKTFPFK